MQINFSFGILWQSGVRTSGTHGDGGGGGGRGGDVTPFGQGEGDSSVSESEIGSDLAS